MASPLCHHGHDHDGRVACVCQGNKLISEAGTPSEHGRSKDISAAGEESEHSGSATLQQQSDVNPSLDRHISTDSGINRTRSSENNPFHNPIQHQPGDQSQSQSQDHLSSSQSQILADRSEDNGGFSMIKEQLTELNKENSSLRSRVKGVNVLSTSLREAREEVSELNKQKNKMEIAVENLQSRLYRLGANTAVDLEEHEIFLPGHDKQFLNSLISENMRLQKAVKSGTNNASAIMVEEHHLKRIKRLETIVLEFTEKLREKEKVVKQLEDFAKLSDKEKDRELVLLREKVDRQNQTCENAESICVSLTDQAEKLREQVQAKTKDCEEAVSKLQKQELEARQKQSNDTEYQLIKMRHVGTNLKPEEQIRILEQQVDQLEKENGRLTDQLKEVIGMNTRWQRYNDQREAYVIKLSKTSYQQQSKITVLEQRCSDLNKEIADLKKDNDRLRRKEAKERDAALVAADQQLSLKDEKIEELQGRVKELTDLVQTKYGGQLPSDVGEKEQIEMLKNQISVFANDFQAERRDRQAYEKRCNDAVAELKQRDNLIQMLQEQLQRQQGSSSDYSRQTSAPTRQYIPYNQSCGQQMIARGGSGQRSYYGQDMPDLPTDDVETDGHHGFDEPDIGPRVLRGEEDVDYQGGVVTDSEENDEDEPLQCPHCFQNFKVVDHDKFMAHAMSCIEQN